MPLLNVVVMGTQSGGKKLLVKQFLENKTDSEKTSISSHFDRVLASLIHKQVPVTVDGIKYSLKITETYGWQIYFQMNSPLYYHDADVIIVVFSAFDDDSYKAIEENWSKEVINCCQNTSVILVRYEKKQDHFFPSQILHHYESPIAFVTSEMGEQLARRINATLYLQCSENDQTQTDNIFQIAVRASIHHEKENQRKQLLTFRTDVIGHDNSGKTDLIRRFVFGKRLSVCGGYLNEDQLFHNLDETSFSTSIEIDGEEFGFDVGLKEISLFNSSRTETIANANVIVIVFSIFEPD